MENELNVSTSSSVLESVYMCERHKERAYFLCNEQKCQLPILICNQCSQDDHPHDSTAIKKVEKMLTENDKNFSSDITMSTIKSFYHDMRELVLKMLEDDEKQFTEYILAKKDGTVDSEVRDCIRNLREKQFSKVTSSNLRSAMEYMKNCHLDNNIQHEIESALDQKRNIVMKMRSEWEGNKINNVPRWEYILPDGKKIRDTQNNVYRINFDCNLIGNRILEQRVHKWKVVFTQIDTVQCIGFGVGSLDSLSMADVSVGSVLSCLCCNGPWSGLTFDIKDNIRIKDKLNAKESSIMIEINRNKGLIILYDPQGKVHGEKRLDGMKSTRLVPIIKRGGSAKVQFRVEHLIC